MRDVGNQRERRQQPDLHFAGPQREGVSDQKDITGEIGVEVGEDAVPGRQTQGFAKGRPLCGLRCPFNATER